MLRTSNLPRPMPDARTNIELFSRSNLGSNLGAIFVDNAKRRRRRPCQADRDMRGIVLVRFLSSS